MNNNIEDIKRELRALVSDAACCGCNNDRCDLCGRPQRFSKQVEEIFKAYEN